MATIDELKAQLAAAKLSIDALSEDDVAEEALRAEVARAQADAAAAAKRRRALEMERAIDAAKTRLPNTIFLPMDLEDSSPGGGHYVIRSPGKVQWETYQREVESANANGAPVDLAARTALVISCVVFPDTSTEGPAIRARWDQRPGAVLSLFNAAAKLGSLVVSEGGKRAR